MNDYTGNEKEQVQSQEDVQALGAENNPIDGEKEQLLLKRVIEILEEKNGTLQNTINGQKEVIRLFGESHNGQQKLIDQQEERIKLQEELLVRLRQKVGHLNEQLEEIEGAAETGSNGTDSAVRFPRPTKKSLLKKQSRKRV